MRFDIYVDENWQVIILSPKLEPGQALGHPMDRRDDDDHGPFPFPPPHGLGQYHMPADGFAPEDVEQLGQAYDRITRGRPQGDDVRRFGRHLFNALLGNEWETIVQLATADADPVVELALSWKPGQHDLHRLNWEMMHSPHGFLARGLTADPNPKLVAITRRVVRAAPVQSGDPLIWSVEPLDVELQQVEAPPRVLFVFGAPLSDPQIRAAAEYHSLLRQVRAQNRTIQALVLRGKSADRGASPSQIREAVAAFQPHAVHFICHGNVDHRGGYLELGLDEGETEADRPRYAQQLIEMLTPDMAAGRTLLPNLIMLSACYSAGAGEQNLDRTVLLSTGDAAPLAAELVSHGIPVVAGMGGRIADQACRLFSRQFGAALVAGEPLAIAAALGRRAVYFGNEPPATSVDWCLPTLFLAEYVPENYAPVQVLNPDPAVLIETWISDLYHLPADPVFCGRDEFFQAYYDLFSGSKKVLLIYTAGGTVEQPGLGRTRLLQELTAQALRDGHIPCLFSPPDAAQYPTTVSQLGIAILREIARTRQVFDLPAPLDSALLASFQAVETFPNFYQARQTATTDRRQWLLFLRLLDYYSNLNVDPRLLGEDTIRQALEEDLIFLVQDACEYAQTMHQIQRAYPPIRETSQAIVLLDNVDRFGAVAQQALFDTILAGVGRVGLGDQNHPVPVIAVYSGLQPFTAPSLQAPRPTEAAWLEQLVRTRPSWLNPLELKAFESNGEDLLAYARTLLFPTEKRREAGRPPLNHPWATNPRVNGDAVEACEMFLRNMLLGIPDLMVHGDKLERAIGPCMKLHYLIDADDTQVFEAFETERRRILRR